VAIHNKSLISSNPPKLPQVSLTAKQASPMTFSFRGACVSLVLY